ncbi:RNA polymerase II transcription elongation factor-domain-containing protein [Cercophora newfieldiana]|uniref:RNA polymerase II transcription elongation factor-domain-containing protein n=1 Tax=Cercophora newfieldiana TaxID=92897 RepID=A0AA39YPS8_9PEZI|nr:RNA polymerase II transcription elongation factor-domain-containing protein [Cercophora newfieldiana]
MAAPGAIDPTKPAKYPIILSDALLGKTSKETYTGVRYNHRPTLSSDAAPSTSRLKKSAKDGSYNLGFEDHGDKYQYNGVRTTEDGNYVLIFDPARKAFVLHRVDSMFHMNLTKTPTDGAEALRKKFPQLEVSNASGSSKQQPKGKDAPATTEKAKPAPAKGKGKEKAAPKEPAAKGKKAKPEKAAPKPMELTLPTAAPTPPMPKKAFSPPPKAPAEEEKKPKRRALSPVESEEEDSDGDGGLILEFPDGDPPSSFRSNFPPMNAFSPAFPTTRRFSELVRGQDDGDDDIDAEGDDEIEDEEYEFEPVKLPSPITRQALPEPERFEFEPVADAEGDEIDEEGLYDLEAELEKAFNEVKAQESDSSMSEEE